MRGGQVVKLTVLTEMNSSLRNNRDHDGRETTSLKQLAFIAFQFNLAHFVLSWS